VIQDSSTSISYLFTLSCYPTWEGTLSLTVVNVSSLIAAFLQVIVSIFIPYLFEL